MPMCRLPCHSPAVLGASAPGVRCGTKPSFRGSRPVSKTLKAAGSAGYETLEPEEDLRETPTKVVTRTLMVPVRAQTSLVDFEGRTDRASISRILGQVAPCQIIILHGHPEVSCGWKPLCTGAPALVAPMPASVAPCLLGHLLWFSSRASWRGLAKSDILVCLVKSSMLHASCVGQPKGNVDCAAEH